MNEEVKQQIINELREDILNKIENEFSEIRMGYSAHLEKNEWLSYVDKINARLNQIEKMIVDHSVGVQNVYQEMQKVKDICSKVDVDKFISYTQSLQWHEFTEKYNVIKDFMESDEVRKILDSFDDFKDEFFYLTSKKLKMGAEK